MGGFGKTPLGGFGKTPLGGNGHFPLPFSGFPPFWGPSGTAPPAQGAPRCHDGLAFPSHLRWHPCCVVGRTPNRSQALLQIRYPRGVHRYHSNHKCWCTIRCIEVANGRAHRSAHPLLQMLIVFARVINIGVIVLSSSALFSTQMSRLCHWHFHFVSDEQQTRDGTSDQTPSIEVGNSTHIKTALLQVFAGAWCTQQLTRNIAS